MHKMRDVLVGFLLLGMFMGLVSAQPAKPDTLLVPTKSHFELVKAGRDFCEQLAAQVIASLEEQLKQAQDALTQYKAQHPEVLAPASSEGQSR